MTDKAENISKEDFDPLKPIENVNRILDSFHETADVERVFGKPIKVGDSLIIPAAEVVVGMGFGLGAGYGQPDEEEPELRLGGGGGGAGGSTHSRPVAVIIASPEGVRVEPVFDLTKIALAGITAAGFMASMVMRMMRSPQAGGR
jgi:uncharacterized spore protein YtfJ